MAWVVMEGAPAVLCRWEPPTEGVAASYEVAFIHRPLNGGVEVDPLIEGYVVPASTPERPFPLRLNYQTSCRVRAVSATGNEGPWSEESDGSIARTFNPDVNGDGVVGLIDFGTVMPVFQATLGSEVRNGVILGAGAE